MSCCIARRCPRSLTPSLAADHTAKVVDSDVKHIDVDVGDGVTLHAVITGNGPPLILLHGFTGSTETWDPLRGFFDGNHQAVAVDLPGHGRSSDPADPRRYSLDSFADDLARLLDALQLDRIALLGYSMGGRAALQFILSHPDRVAALILESTSPGITDPAGRRERVAADSALADMIEGEGVPAFVDRWERLPLWESQWTLPEAARAELRAQRLRNRPAGLAASLRGAGTGASVPVTELLSTLHVPTLVIAGALDTRYVELAQLLVASLPDAHLSVIPGAGHAAHLEKPHAFGTRTSAFLRDIPSEGRRWL